MTWQETVALAPLGPRSFTGHIGEEWNALQGVNGGAVAALAVTAAERVLAAEQVAPGTSLRAATFGYVNGTSAGEVAVAVDVVRHGRTMVTTHIQVSQGGRPTMVGRLHHSTPRDGLRFSDVPAPGGRPEGATRLSDSGRSRHFELVETWMHPDTTAFAGADRAEWLAWSRPLPGEGPGSGDGSADGNGSADGGCATIDTAWLTMLGDLLPPAVFTRTSEPVRAVSVEYSLQIHCGAGPWTLPPDGYVATRMHAFHSHAGFAVEDGWLHLPDGTLLATTRQTRLAG